MNFAVEGNSIDQLFDSYSLFYKLQDSVKQYPVEPLRNSV